MNQALPPTKTWLLVARALAGWFAFVSFLGYFWNPIDEYAPLEHAYFAFTIAALIIYALVPTKILVPYRFPAVGISVVAIAFSFPQIFQDFSVPGGADYFAIVLRLIVCALLVLISTALLRAAREAV
jgi:hypothetical protein